MKLYFQKISLIFIMIKIKETSCYNFISDNDDWLWEDKNNNMTCLIWDRSPNKTYNIYQLIAVPSYMADENIDNIDFNSNAISLGVTDKEDKLNDWLDELYCGNYNNIEKPEYIIQNEAIHDFINYHLLSGHLTESNNSFYEEKLFESFNIDKETLTRWRENGPLSDEEVYNIEKMHEGLGTSLVNMVKGIPSFISGGPQTGFRPKLMKFLAGGGAGGFGSTILMSFLPMILKSLGLSESSAMIAFFSVALAKCVAAVYAVKSTKGYYNTNALYRTAKCAAAIAAQIAHTYAAWNVAVFGPQATFNKVKDTVANFFAKLFSKGTALENDAINSIESTFQSIHDNGINISKEDITDNTSKVIDSIKNSTDILPEKKDELISSIETSLSKMNKAISENVGNMKK